MNLISIPQEEKWNLLYNKNTTMLTNHGTSTPGQDIMLTVSFQLLALSSPPVT